MPVNFSRGAPPKAPFGAGLLPLDQKEDLCRSLLSEFGITHIRERRQDSELIHACLIDPTHRNQDAEPTASLNFDKLTYKCLGCQASGGLLWFIAEVRGCTSQDALNWLNQETGLAGHVMDLDLLMKYFDSIYKPKAGLPPIPTYPERMLEPWNLIHPYLTDPKDQHGRGIPVENVTKMRLGYAEDYKVGKDVRDNWVTSERIVIPHFWKDRLVGWQTRRLDARDGTPKYLSSADFPKDQTIYNYQPRAERVVVMEAMLSAVSKVHLEEQTGPPEATFGANVTDEQVRLLAKHSVVVLCMDNDDAGWKAVEGRDDLWPSSGQVKEHHEGLGERLGRSCVVLVWENPYAADPQDLSDEDYLHLVNTAVPFSVWRRPKTLLCYSCKEIAHDGRC